MVFEMIKALKFLTGWVSIYTGSDLEKLERLRDYICSGVYWSMSEEISKAMPVEEGTSCLRWSRYVVSAALVVVRIGREWDAMGLWSACGIKFSVGGVDSRLQRRRCVLLKDLGRVSESKLRASRGIS